MPVSAVQSSVTLRTWTHKMRHFQCSQDAPHDATNERHLPLNHLLLPNSWQLMPYCHVRQPVVWHCYLFSILY